MKQVTDATIRSWISSGERFEGRSVGEGLVLSFRKEHATPIWKFRYSFSGKSRGMNLGSYRNLTLASARKTAKELRSRVALGYDVAEEKQERKRSALAAIESKKHAQNVAQLADEYFERNVRPRWKHPDIVRARIEKDIKPCLGELAIQDVRPIHVDEMLQRIVKRNAKTVANDVLRWTRRMFDYAVRRQLIQHNPAAAFNLSDAGGKEEARDRTLTLDEVVKLLEALRQAEGLPVENQLALKLLLMLAVRKCELTAARVDEFDLVNAAWHLPSDRTKTEQGIVIPLPPPALAAVRELVKLGHGSAYLLPARKRQVRKLPHIAESTLNAALAKVRPLMAETDHFTVHDFRRTARTQLSALGVSKEIAELCLNHKPVGIVGRYDKWKYFDERREALAKWAVVIEGCEAGQGANVVAFKQAARG
ncbi:site-specific integrase [Nevskia sp.]|uniref:tyrosine-type recombinase/integrase n=1 Tax=Nevskia sp. TaxID=1929292 RepID=UPI0025E9865D|nr:site-specific integrase [Nevskia sp.]